MCRLLQSKGLWSTLSANQHTFTRECETFFHTNKFEKAMGLIQLHVFDNLLFHIKECNTPKEMCDELQNIFGQVSEFHAL